MTAQAPQQFHSNDSGGVPPVQVRLKESFDEIVEMNPDLHIEQTATGELVFMTPTGGESGYRNAMISSWLFIWAESHGGRAFDSSTLFQLPNGAKRSPDASWISESRWQQLTVDQRKGYPPLCPDLVVELRSESDRLVDLQEKMVEYMANGARLGWLIDPLLKQVHVYRPNGESVCLDSPRTISDQDVCPELLIELERIWDVR